MSKCVERVSVVGELVFAALADDVADERTVQPRYHRRMGAVCGPPDLGAGTVAEGLDAPVLREGVERESL